MKRNNKKGFTIVELVIVIAVIAILAAVLIPTFGGIVDKAKENAALQEAKTIMTNYTASIDYTKETPEDTYHIVVLKDEKGTGTADDEYYIFTVTNGVLDDEVEEGTLAAKLTAGDIIVKKSATEDGWPEVSTQPTT